MKRRNLLKMDNWSIFAQMIDTTKYSEDLGKHLGGILTEKGLLEGLLPGTPDIDSRWHELGPYYCADAVREYNAYPDVALAWAAYLGMAVASCWDSDWEHASSLPYTVLQGEKGFDYMDEYISEKFLGMKPGTPEAEKTADLLRELSVQANSFMLHYGAERGSTDAYRLFLETTRVMYVFGAGLQLKSLGYSFQKI